MRKLLALLLMLGLAAPVLALDVDVRAFGAKCDNSTDDVLAIRKAVAAVSSTAGGGTVLFPPGTCVLTTVGTYSVKVPVSGANFSTTTESDQYHVLLQNVGNVKLKGFGTVLRSTVTNGGHLILGDGVQNFSMEGFELKSVYAHDVAGTVTTTGMGAISFTAQTQDSYNVQLTNLKLTNVYTGIYIFGDTASAYRVRGVSIENVRHDNGHYTLALHNNGDNVKAQYHSSNVLRDFFIYGSTRYSLQVTSDTTVAGFTPIVKAYDRDTVGGDIKYTTTRVPTSTISVAIQSQHAPAVQPTPKRILGLTLDITNVGTNVSAADFSYYRDTTLTATSANNLFNGIVLKGVVDQPPTVSSTQNGASAARGTLNTDNLVLLNGALYSVYNRTGFMDSKQVYNTFTPALKINASAVGITYGGATVGEFWRDGQFIEGYARIVLTSKGASVGPVTIDAPVQSGNYNSSQTTITAIGTANMAGLSGPITGYVQNAGTLISLQIQGAAASASMTDANLSNTSDFTVYFRYPL